MHVLDNLEVVLVDGSGTLASQVEAQQRQQPVVERFACAKLLRAGAQRDSTQAEQLPNTADALDRLPWSATARK
jgi:hypothetical protein